MGMENVDEILILLFMYILKLYRISFQGFNVSRLSKHAPKTWSKYFSE